MDGIPSSLEELAGKQALSLLLSLLPGLIASEIIYALTVREKKELVERVIQALVHTFVIYVIWQGLVLVWGAWVSYTWRWNYGLSGPVRPGPAASLIGLAVCAVLWGLGAAWAVNSECVHRFLQQLGITASSSHPSQWYTAFYSTRGRRYIVAHLKDGRRLFGWPKLWPNDPCEGHLFLMEASWLSDDGAGEAVRLTDVLIDVASVDCIEFVPLGEEPETPDVREDERQKVCGAEQADRGGEIKRRDELRSPDGTPPQSAPGSATADECDAEVREEVNHGPVCLDSADHVKQS